MKITDLKPYIVGLVDRTPWLFVEVHTDEGVVGLGECSEYHSTPILARAVELVKPLVVGQDPGDIEEIWQRLFRHYSSTNPRGFISHVISAIDIALWDIRGKVLGVPVYQLLGGPVRDRVPMYTHVRGLLGNHPPAAEARALALEQAREIRSLGYEAIKTDPFRPMRSPAGRFMGADQLEWLTPAAFSEAADFMMALREELGSGFELLVDAHARFDVASAIAAARAMEPVKLTWFEEPVAVESYPALREFRENTDIPVSIGERHFTRYDYLPIFEHRLADFVMPDVCWTGGISELRRIGHMAEAYYVRISPHDALGPVNIAAGFHVGMTMANFYRLEAGYTQFDAYSEIITPMFDYHDGSIWPTDRPGLGIELNHGAIGKYLLDPEDIRAGRSLELHPAVRRATA